MQAETPFNHFLWFLVVWLLFVVALPPLWLAFVANIWRHPEASHGLHPRRRIHGHNPHDPTILLLVTLLKREFTEDTSHTVLRPVEPL